MIEKEFVEIFGVKCYRAADWYGLNDKVAYSGKLNENITFLYTVDLLKFEVHLIYIYDIITITYGGGKTLEEAKINVSKNLKKTIDDINLIKSRIL